MFARRDGPSIPKEVIDHIITTRGLGKNLPPRNTNDITKMEMLIIQSPCRKIIINPESSKNLVKLVTMSTSFDIRMIFLQHI